MPVRRSPARGLVALGAALGAAVLCHGDPAPPERPPVVPYWVFGHWIWEDEVHTRDAVEHIVSGYRLHDIPVAAVLFDSPWAESYNDFSWDPEHYPRAQDMIDDLHARGIRVVVFYTGAINRESNDTRKQKCASYDLALERGYTINGGRESSWWKGPAVHVDFTNPAAVAWWRTQLAAVHAMGADGAKIDAAHARFGKTVATSIGPMTNHQFGWHYFERAFEYHLANNPDFVAMTYAWSGMGLIGYPSLCHVNWVGDFRGDWQGMQDQRRQIYKSAQDGFSAVACEIGGFWKVPSTKEQFIRYAQLSCFMPVMINGGQLGALAHHLPWNHDAETVALYRESVLTHTDLAPYLFSAAVDVHERGGSLIGVVDAEAGSHRLGPDLFVQTLASEANDVVVTLPADHCWIELGTDRVLAGGAIVTRTCSLAEYPVYVRAGAILPVGGRNTLLGGATTSAVASAPSTTTFLIYPQARSTLAYHEPLAGGIASRPVELSMDAATGTLRVRAAAEREFIFLVKSRTAPTAVHGADAWTFEPERNLLRIQRRAANCEIRIEGMQTLASSTLAESQT